MPKSHGTSPSGEDMRVGATLRALREARGIKLGEFANKLGISYAYLSNIEAGRKRLTPPLTAKAAQLLVVPPIALVLPDEFPEAAA
jgi:transcriptional regulator with XRE-family HTH domain